MKHNSYITFACTLLLLCIGFQGQAQKELYSSGLKYFEAKQYEKALEFFYADKYGTGNKDLLIRRVISNYQLGNLEAAKQDVSSLLAFDVAPEELYLYIGKIFHAEGNYRKAIDNYKAYLRRLSPKSEQRKEIIHLVKQCGEALKIKYQDPKAFVDNYGAEINTKYDEFRMIQSPNFENKYYFSSARESSTGGKRDENGKKDEEFGTYNSDMYTVELIQGKWMGTEKLNPFINTSRDEIALGFSEDGGVLYYMKGPDYTKGTIYLDSFAINQQNSLTPSRFDSPIKAETGDVYLQVFSSEIILFASNRPGGYGGYDIYISFSEDGKWSKPFNLGPAINTPYDEISPFMTKDGLSLYFSSNKIKSLGAYDVFQSTYDVTSKSWSNPINMGEPINSAGNDIAFYVADNGYTASLTSDRKSGLGGYDLFVAYLKTQEKHQLDATGEVAFLDQVEFVAAGQLVSNTSANQNSPSKASINSRSERKKRQFFKKAKNEEKVVKARPIKPKNQDNEIADTTPNSTPRTTTSKESKEEYTISPLFYTANDEILSPANKRELDILYQLLSTYPALRVVVKSHTIEEGLEAYDLYFSIKRAEKIGDYLSKKGIDASRIALQGYGSNYPIAKTETGGSPSKIAEKLNSRIEFQLLDVEEAPVDITLVQPYIVDYLRDPRGELFKTIEDGLSYRVQIASVKQMYQNQVLLVYNDSMIEKEGTSESYRYTLGLYESHKDARALVKDLANYNITGAFIVPYLNGQRIPKERFLEYAKHYPDLLNFIQYDDE